MTQHPAVVRSVVVPLYEAELLLPGSVVAEVVAYAEPSPPPAGAPGWLLGSIPWRERRVPLLSLDAFLFSDPMPPGGRARIAVMKSLGDHGELPFYGIVCKQIPHLAVVRPENLAAEQAGGAQLPGVSAGLLLNGEPMMIPDLDAIEAALRGALGEYA